MSRIQLALRVHDLDGSVAFYSRVFGQQPARRRPGYANFAVTDPPLKLVLIDSSVVSGDGADGGGDQSTATVLDHLGIEVDSSEQVREAERRLAQAGLETTVEDGTNCCYAVQDKVWVRGPGAEPWEVYVVKADSDAFASEGAALSSWPAAAECCSRR